LRAVGADAARAAPLNLREGPNSRRTGLAAGLREGPNARRTGLAAGLRESPNARRTGPAAGLRESPNARRTGPAADLREGPNARRTGPAAGLREGPNARRTGLAAGLRGDGGGGTSIDASPPGQQAAMGRRPRVERRGFRRVRSNAGRSSVTATQARLWHRAAPP